MKEEFDQVLGRVKAEKNTRVALERRVAALSIAIREASTIIRLVAEFHKTFEPACLELGGRVKELEALMEAR